MSGRYTAPKRRRPDGDGFGKPYVPDPGVTFLIHGAEVSSVLGFNKTRGVEEPQATVAIDMGGKWNHGAKDTLTAFCHPDIAREMAQALLEAADAAERDVITWKELNE